MCGKRHSSRFSPPQLAAAKEPMRSKVDEFLDDAEGDCLLLVGAGRACREVLW